MNRSRRAVSLVELLLVLSASTTILTLSSVLIVRAMRFQMQSRAHCDVERTALRLSNQFRRDVHRAQTATPSPANESGIFLRLESADGKQVEYSRADGTVLRLAPTAGNGMSREEFAFPAGCELNIRELESPPRLELTINSDPNFATASDYKPPLRTVAVPVSLRIEAALGRDVRLSAATEVEEGTP